MALIWGKSRRLWGSPAPLYRHGMRRLLCEFSIFPLKKKKRRLPNGTRIHPFFFYVFLLWAHPSIPEAVTEHLLRATTGLVPAVPRCPVIDGRECELLPGPDCAPCST